MKNDRPPKSEDPAAGEPTGVVETLRHEPPADFLQRIRNKLHRRLLVGDVIDLSWRTPGLLLLQWMLIVVDFLRGGFGTRKGRSDG